jgi:hypothetical protein
MTVEVKPVVEIPITREQVKNVQQTAENIKSYAESLRSARNVTRGAGVVIGWHQVIMQKSAEFFESIGTDLASGNPVEVTTDGILREGETAYKLVYRTSIGSIYNSEGILDQNALYDALYRIGTNPDIWTKQSEIPHFGELLGRGNRVFLTPRDLIASYS